MIYTLEEVCERDNLQALSSDGIIGVCEKCCLRGSNPKKYNTTCQQADCFVEDVYFIDPSIQVTPQKEPSMIFINALNDFKKQENDTLYRAWCAVTTLEKSWSNFYKLVHECLDAIESVEATSINDPITSSTGSIEVQYWKKDKTFRIFVSDHRRIHVRNKPDLAIGQTWKYEDGNVYRVTKVDGKFVLVNLDNFNIWSHEEGFGTDNGDGFTFIKA